MSFESVAYPSGDSLVSTQVSQLQRHGYLFGQKITNSLSPFLHNVIYQDLGLRWGQVRLDSADMSTFLELIQHPDFYGTHESYCLRLSNQADMVYHRRIGYNAK